MLKKKEMMVYAQTPKKVYRRDPSKSVVPLDSRRRQVVRAKAILETSRQQIAEINGMLLQLRQWKKSPPTMDELQQQLSRWKIVPSAPGSQAKKTHIQNMLSILETSFARRLSRFQNMHNDTIQRIARHEQHLSTPPNGKSE